MPRTPKSSTTAPKKVSATPAPDPVADARIKTQFDEAVVRLERARTDETAGWDDLHEALDEILNSEPPLYVAAGFTSAKAFLAKYLPGSTVKTVMEHIPVARHFEPPEIKEYGVSRLGLLLDYLSARGGGPLAPAKLALDKIRVEIVRDKQRKKVRFAEASYDELRAAVRAAGGRNKQGGRTDPPAVKTLRASLKAERLGHVGVRLRGGKLDLTGIPLADVPSLGKLLGKAKLAEGK